MQTDRVARRTEMVRSRVRKLVRRGATTNLSRLLAKVRPEEVAVLMESLTESEQLSLFSVLREYYPETTGAVRRLWSACERTAKNSTS